ncbi:hypothetical protein KY331_02110 [Candidatus Woesearchaeota archaeon]|nr:hypothetical protein [Candidatus Woesearchaeota archaeon]
MADTPRLELADYVTKSTRERSLDIGGAEIITFPLKKGDKALVVGYSAALLMEAAVGRIVRDTNLAMERGRIEKSSLYPIVPGDVVEVALIGFKYRNEEGEHYVDIVEKYKGAPTFFYEVTTLEDTGLLSGEPFGEKAVEDENISPKHLGDLVQSEFYDAVKVHIQIKTHIKYSEEREKSEEEPQTTNNLSNLGEMLLPEVKDGEQSVDPEIVGGEEPERMKEVM